MKKIIIMLISLLFIVNCGGGGGGDDNFINNNFISTSPTTFSLQGSVPGTLIEAFGNNGSYYKTTSVDSNGSKTFTLTLPLGVKFNLFMTVNEGSTNSIVIPIRFGSGTISSSVFSYSATNNQIINLGYLDLPITRQGKDNDGDGVADNFFTHLEEGFKIDIYDSVASSTSFTTKTFDYDGDGIHNNYDNDDGYTQASRTIGFYKDSDGDGVPDIVDANPSNTIDSINNLYSILDRNNDGYLDTDYDRDGYYDDDHDRNGYHDDDHDRDGYSDNDYNFDGILDNSSSYSEIVGTVSSKLGSNIILSNNITVNATNARFEYTNLQAITTGDIIEVEGAYNPNTGVLTAYEIELRSYGSSSSSGGSSSSYYEIYGVVNSIIDAQIYLTSGIIIDATYARFEHINLASLRQGHFIEAEGAYNSITRVLTAYEVELEY